MVYAEAPGTWLDIWRVQFYLCEMGTDTPQSQASGSVCTKQTNLLWESIVNTAKKKKKKENILYHIHTQSDLYDQSDVNSDISAEL